MALYDTVSTFFETLDNRLYDWGKKIETYPGGTWLVKHFLMIVCVAGWVVIIFVVG